MMTTFMLKTRRNWQRGVNLVLLAGAALMLAACGGGGSGDGGSGDGTGGGETSTFNAKALLQNEADNVIYPIYSDMARQAIQMEEAVDKLVQNPTRANVEAARNEWVDTRVYWERSEGFLFGPVEPNRDPRIDSWPLDVTNFQAVIDAGNITQSTIDNADDNVRGFHTEEFLLWNDSDASTGTGGTNGQDNARNVAAALEADANRRDYLKQVTVDIQQTAKALRDAWTPGDDSNFGHLLETAGAPENNTYPSQRAGVQELIDGMETIANEVGSSKIADPFKQHDTKIVESKHSFNSRKDFMNDIRGVKHIYLGDFPFQSDGGSDGPGVTDFVQAAGANTIDMKVREQIDYAIKQINKIPQPFRDSINGSNAQQQQVQNAIDATLELRKMLQQDVEPLLDRVDFAK